MKQLKTITAAIIVMLAASSCKKTNDITPPPAAPATKITKIEYPSSGTAQTFTYNSAGRLINAKNSSFNVSYNYTPSPYEYEIFNSVNQKQYELINKVFTANRLTSFDYRSYRNDGTVNYTEPFTVQYDANGYQTAKTYPGYVYAFTIAGGNTTGYTQTNTTSGLVRTYTREYTAMPDKLNLNLFEHWYQDQLLSDMEVMGKKNTNLPKKLTYTSGANNEVIEYAYVMNAEGLPAECTVKETKNGGTPTTWSFKLSYQ